MEEAADKPSFWALPTTAKGSGSVALWLTVVLEGLLIAQARSADPFFYWWLKVAFPVCAGCLAALIYARREPRDFRECASTAMR